MVSLWPWRGDDTSPASFEKALSALSVKISRSQLLLDSLRQSSRRLKALWTLYTSFAYLLCGIILALVVGWKNWSALEYSALAGSPLIIYLVRAVIDTYYSYRINSVTRRLEEQQTEREKTIDKLKAATKYNSTQQLLEKYGAESPKTSPKPKGTRSPARTPKAPAKQSGRTSMGPPATANIPRNQPLNLVPAQINMQPSNLEPQPSLPRLPPSLPESPLPLSGAGQSEFAPNAFASTPQYDTSDLNADGKWYDRILDLLLGDDETSPKNRVVLICKNCRLVNGQAPPGVKRLEDIGKWRCIGCGGWNGEQDEGTKIMEEMKEKVKLASQDQLETSDSDKSDEGVLVKAEKDDEVDDDTVEDEDHNEQEGEPVKKTRRGRSKKGTSS